MRNLYSYLLGISFFGGTFLSIGCVYYLLDQGKGQMEILLDRKPLKKIQKEHPSLQVRQKLAFVEKVRHFAKHTLGMDSQNYTYFVEIKQEAIGYNVSACAPLAFQPLTWTFPLVGTVPYLGFFEKGYAVGLKYRLQEEGYDVVLQEIAGFSTLGWFRDPLFSTMLQREPYGLAELILHEITHSHIYHPSHSKFNENVATFIGQEGTKEFLKKYYGSKSYLYREYLRYLADSQQFQKIIYKIYQELDKVYRSSLSQDQKKLKKKEIFAKGKKILKLRQKNFQSQAYQNIFLPQWNNAMILSLLRYHGKQKALRKLFRKMKGDWKSFISFLKKQCQIENPWQGIE